MIMRLRLKEDPPTITAQQKGETIAYKWLNRRRVPYIKHFEKYEVTAVRNYYKALVLTDLRCQKSKIPRFVGAVSLKVVFIFKARRKKDIGKPKPTKPDCDNMNKLLQDVFDEMGFFEVGDQQVTHLEVDKIYAEQPGIYIEIKQQEESEALNDIFTV